MDEDELSAMTVVELKAQLRELGLPISGKKADLIALSQNIVLLAETGATNRISDTKVMLTVFDGNITFDSSTH